MSRMSMFTALHFGVVAAGMARAPAAKMAMREMEYFILKGMIDCLE